MFKTFTTLRGAKRAARRTSGEDRPILRILNAGATDHLFIVLDSMGAELHAIDPKTGHTDGKITFYDLTARA